MINSVLNSYQCKSVPTVPRPGTYRAQLQAAPLLAVPTVPTVPIINKQMQQETQNEVVWLELPDPSPGSLMVTCYTPNGNPIEVTATSPEHEKQLRWRNPKPKHRSSTND
jgi:hypothetical protein